eukprot:6454057-Amphidinium_carterae.1
MFQHVRFEVAVVLTVIGRTGAVVCSHVLLDDFDRVLSFDPRLLRKNIQLLPAAELKFFFWQSWGMDEGGDASATGAGWQGLVQHVNVHVAVCGD